MTSRVSENTSFSSDNFCANANRRLILFKDSALISSSNHSLRFNQLWRTIACAREKLPFAMAAMLSAVSGAIPYSSLSKTAKSFLLIGLNPMCWQRDTIVGRRSALCVAIRTSIARSGGSSNIFRSALLAAAFIAWASDITTTRMLASYGFMASVATSSRI